MNSSTVSIFESFNARPLTPALVAKTFVPPAHYEQLRKRTHTLLIGPRGSGKTTLLKMLHPHALETWEHPTADAVCKSLDFTGVFVPTDQAWGKQLEALSQGRLPASDLAFFGTAIFTNHIIISFLRTLRHRCSPDSDSVKRRFRPIYASPAAVRDFIKSAADLLKIEDFFPSLDGLILALTDRNLAIGAAASGKVLNLTTFQPFIGWSYNDVLVSLIQRVEMFLGTGEQTWCILLDEFELAPTYIREALLAGLRSTNSSLLFKIGISPFTTDAHLLSNPTSPMAFHDFEEIRLWYPKKQEGYEISHLLFNRLAVELGLPPITPEQALGDSIMAGRLEYSQSQRMTQGQVAVLERLAKWDVSFRTYLKDKSVDIAKISSYAESKRAAAIRKIIPLVIIREAFLKGNAKSVKPVKPDIDLTGRSRKNPALYGGAGSIFALCEGNPRIFLGIVRQLLALYRETGKRVEYTSQNMIIEKSIKRLRAILRTIVPSSSSGSMMNLNLSKLIDLIGNQLHRGIVQPNFSSDPPGSFTVDCENLTQEVVDLLVVALNSGAIIYMPTIDEQLVFGNLNGRTFRLSYLLAPYYYIPLRLGPEISLSSLLKRSSRVPCENKGSTQLDLFN